jgi:hypothetical protein
MSRITWNNFFGQFMPGVYLILADPVHGKFTIQGILVWRIRK